MISTDLAATIAGLGVDIYATVYLGEDSNSAE